jgi:hypothetical protein
MRSQSRLGISEVEAEVLPAQKSAIVGKLQKAGRIVAMAGDGVNDALPSPRPKSESRSVPAPTSRWKARLQAC